MSAFGCSTKMRRAQQCSSKGRQKSQTKSQDLSRWVGIQAGVQSTVLARTKMDRLIKECTTVVKHMLSAAFLKKIVSKGVKTV